MKSLKRTGECNHCGLCCQWFTLTMEKVISRDHLKYYRLHNVKVDVKNGKTILKFPLVCSAYDPEKKICKIHGRRQPIFCMQFPQVDDADKLPKECSYRFVKEEL